MKKSYYATIVFERVSERKRESTEKLISVTHKKMHQIEGEVFAALNKK
jgi:hypothetical protein